MVPKASDDFPEPDTPVNTASTSRGTSTSTPLRLCSRAPRTRTYGSCGLDITECSVQVCDSGGTNQAIVCERGHGGDVTRRAPDDGGEPPAGAVSRGRL